MSHPSHSASLAYQLATTLEAHGSHTHSDHQHPPLDAILQNKEIDLTQILHSNKTNEEITAATFYKSPNYTPEELKDLKPWKKDLKYFKTVYISSLALTKMTIHADSGGDIEVMGMLIGKIIKEGMVIMDTYSLPVVGTETRVNAAAESYEYMASYLDHLKKVGYRDENIVGWYHSHPGYGCWLSGIDVATESLNQTYQDPYLAIVIDPKKTKVNGKVEIGAFRTFPEGKVPKEKKKSKSKKITDDDDDDDEDDEDGEGDDNKEDEDEEYDENSSMIPSTKLQDFGAHSSKYYSLEVKIFKSKSDENILKLLLENYWISGLSGLLDDSDINEDIEIVDKFESNINFKLSSLLNKLDKYIEKYDSTKTYRKHNNQNISFDNDEQSFEDSSIKINQILSNDVPKLKKTRLNRKSKKLLYNDDDDNYDDYDDDDDDDDQEMISDLSKDEDSEFENDYNNPMRTAIATKELDIKMKDVGDDDDDNYNSIDSDTSVENGSIFSTNSPSKLTRKINNNFMSKINNNEVEKKLEKKYLKRTGLMEYYKSKKNRSEVIEDNSLLIDNQNKIKIDKKLLEFDKHFKQIAGEELRNSINLNLQKSLFFGN